MARITTVKSARKPQGKCGKCGVEIEKGDGYRWAKPGFRTRRKMVRCMKTLCMFRPSELDQSKKATILAAQENFEDNIDHCTTADEITEAVEEVATAVREVADEYREALDQWENGNSMMEEFADHYEEQANEIEGFALNTTVPDEPDESSYVSEEVEGDDEDEVTVDDGGYEEAVDEWQSALEDAKQEARDAVEGIELM